MAGAKPGVHVVQLKPIVVPQFLKDGAKFIKWDDDSGQATPVTLRVDKNGFFLYWTDQNKETEFLEISCIRDTRTGKYVRPPKDPKLHYVTNIGSQNIPIEEKTLVIAYGSDFVNTSFLNFSCDRREIAKEWADELLNMAYNLMALNASAITTLEKAHVKLILSVDKDGKIPVKNILKMFAQNREDKKRVERALESAGVACGKNDSTSPSAFPFEVFFNFYKHLTGRSEVEKIFDELCKCSVSGSKHKSHMTVDQLVTFLNQQQRDPRLNEILYPYVTHERARDIINQYEANKGSSQKGHMSFEGFLRYLMSDDNAIVAPEKFGLSEDMNQPLSHYFINSSHNTYLTGHQLTGRSSVEMYRQCLLAGCRCIELDCWNGKTSEDEPIITHGYTVVREVNFKDVIDAIAESAFKTSDFPVILSFENHCSPRVQAKMATYCQKVFGDMLLSEPLQTHPVELGQPLPSPNQLVKKIIIKNKKKHYHHRGNNNTASGNGELKGAGIGSAAGGTSAPVVTSDSKPESATTARLQKANSKDSQNEGSSGNINGGTEAGGATLAPNGDLDDTEFESESEDEYVAGPIDQKESADWETGTAGKESEAGAEMSALVNYIQPVHFHSFEVSEKRNRSYEISSFGETSAATLLKEYPVDFVNYNKRQLSRIYPKGTRVDSSNYMPQVFWNAGCQLVALNFQTLDLPMQLNLGIFEYNGRCGYLLKPDFMRRVDRKFDPFAESTVDGIIAGSLSVKIISGQFLSDKRVGTYVEVESYGLPADTVRKRKFKTKVVPANGINPVYDDEPFVFKKVVLPDLCVIRIVACEENGKVIGHRVLPLVGLRPGYRHIGLRNESGQLLTLPSLFVYITVKDYVPDKLSDIADALVNPIKYQSEKEKRELQLSTLTDDYDETSETSMSDEPKKSKSDISETQKPKTSRTDDSGDGSRTVPSDGSVGPVHPLLTDVSSSSDKEPKRKGSKKTPPLIRTDVPEPHRDTCASIEIPEHLLVVESLEKFKESELIKKYCGNLECRLQDLEKRHSKLETKKSDSLKREEEKFEKKLKGGCKRLRKKSNGTNIDVSSAIKQSDGPVTEPEKALKREHSRTMLTLYENNCKEVLEAQQYYHKQIYDAIEKCMQCSHTKQLKSLDEYHDSLKDDVKKKSSVQRAEEMVELKKNYRDKNERARVKREIEQRQITQAVAELQKLEDYFIAKRKEVERRQEEVRKMFESDKEKALEKLKLEYDENMLKWRKKCLPDDAPPCNAPDTQEEVTAL